MKKIIVSLIPWQFLVVFFLGVCGSLFPAWIAFIRFAMVPAIVVTLFAAWLLVVALVVNSFLPLKSWTFRIFLLASWAVSINLNNGEVLDWSYIWLVAVFGGSIARYALVELSWKLMK